MRAALAVAVLLAACNRTTSPSLPAQPSAPPSIPVSGAPPSTGTPAAPIAPPGTRCDDMSATQCLEAPRCVLERRAVTDTPLYACRDAAGPCEGGVAQFDARFSVDCAARAGCRFEAPECFCPSTAHTRVPSPLSPISCMCGGGAPPRCVVAR
jgi:hypothetical protein